MKLIAVLFSFLIGSAAYADEVTIKITSFYPVEANSKIAELCGVVTGAGDHVHLKAIVDPKNNPAVYNLFAGKDGKFCTVVVTYTGRVSVELMDAAGAGAIVEGSLKTDL